MCDESEQSSINTWLDELISSGRMPIFRHNIEIVNKKENADIKQLINEHSSEAGLTIIGFTSEEVSTNGRALFEGYDELGNVLFVNSSSPKVID